MYDIHSMSTVRISLIYFYSRQLIRLVMQLHSFVLALRNNIEPIQCLENGLISKTNHIRWTYGWFTFSHAGVPSTRAVSGYMLDK
jgi:hypothetical protein